MLQNSLDIVLGTKTKVRLLRSLIFLDRPVTGREAARLANVSHIALHALDELVLVGILEQAATSSGHLYQINEANYLFESLFTLFWAEKERYSIIIESIQSLLARFEDVLSADFFGSAARGEETPESDLDLFLILKEGASKEGIKDSLTEMGFRLLNEYGITFSPVILTIDEVKRQLKDRESFVVQALESTHTVFGQTIGELLDGEAV